MKLVDCIPKMKSNTQDGYDIYSYTRNGDRHKGVYQLFDKNDDGFVEIRYGEYNSFLDIDITFPEPINIKEYKLICSHNNGPKTWVLKGFDDKNELVVLNEGTFNGVWSESKECKCIVDNPNKFSKIRFAVTSKISPYNGDCFINEIYFYKEEYEKFYLLLKDNKYYTIDNKKLVLLDHQVLDKANLENNAFKDLYLLDNIDKTDMKLLVYDESNPCELKFKSTLKKPFKPINKFSDEIKIYRKGDI